MHTLPYSSSSTSPSPSSVSSDTSLTRVHVPPPLDSHVCVIALDTRVVSHFLDGALLTSEKKDELITIKANWQFALQKRDDNVLEFLPTARSVKVYNWARKTWGYSKFSITTTVLSELRNCVQVDLYTQCSQIFMSVVY